MWVGNENPGLHVVMYENVYGAIPLNENGQRTLVVMHLDDNKENGNPLNLYAGTPGENRWDADAKGRRPIGAAKLYQDAINKYVALSNADEAASMEQKIKTIATELKRPLHAVKMILDIQKNYADHFASMDEETREAAFRTFLRIEQESWCDQKQTANVIWLMANKPDILKEWTRGDMVDPIPAMDNAQVSDEAIREAAMKETKA